MCVLGVPPQSGRMVVGVLPQLGRMVVGVPPQSGRSVGVGRSFTSYRAVSYVSSPPQHSWRVAGSRKEGRAARTGRTARAAPSGSRSQGRRGRNITLQGLIPGSVNGCAGSQGIRAGCRRSWAGGPGRGRGADQVGQVGRARAGRALVAACTLAAEGHAPQLGLRRKSPGLALLIVPHA